jgi:hypothetical protein
VFLSEALGSGIILLTGGISMNNKKTLLITALIFTFLMNIIIGCKEHNNSNGKKDKETLSQEIQDIFITEKNNISDEWILFIYAQKAYNFKNRKDIVFGQNLDEYSERLELGIVSILKRRYKLNIETIDDFFNLSVTKEGLYNFNEEYDFIDYRIKYSLASYGYAQLLFWDSRIHEIRAAQGSAFYYIRNKLPVLLGPGNNAK